MRFPIAGLVALTLSAVAVAASVPTPDWLATGVSNGQLGANVVTADIDGDGEPDLVLATASNDPNARVRAYNFESGTLLWALPAPADSSGFGASIAAGDLNGDGRDDLAVGAPSSAGSKGAVYVYRIDGLSPAYVQTRWGEANNQMFGWAVEIADVRCDAAGAELVVAAPYYGTGQLPCAGRVYATTFNETFSAVASASHTGEAFTTLGWSMAAYPTGGACDALAVGAPRANHEAGRVQILQFPTGQLSSYTYTVGGAHYGSAVHHAGTGFVVAAVDENGGAGRAWFRSGTAVGGSPGEELVPPSTMAGGQFGISAHGEDFDGDGFPEISVGQPGYDSATASNAGRIITFVRSVNTTPRGRAGADPRDHAAVRARRHLGGAERLARPRRRGAGVSDEPDRRHAVLRRGVPEHRPGDEVHAVSAAGRRLRVQGRISP